MRQQPGARHPAAEIKALTALRGIAAMAVVMQHFSATAERHSAGWIPSLVPHGYMAVDFFFVLSGFIMSYTYLASFQAQGMQAYVPFLLKRVARIFPLGLAALALILLLAAIASFWGHQNWFINPSVVQSGLALPILINILHIQGFIDHTNLNDPSWSISVELGAYLLFPAFIWLVFRAPRLIWAAALLAGAAVLTIAALTQPRLGLGLRNISFDFARCCIEFCFGMGVYALYRRGGSLRVLGTDRWTWAVSAAACALLVLRLDLPLAFLFPWLILAWAWNDGRASRGDVLAGPLFSRDHLVLALSDAPPVPHAGVGVVAPPVPSKGPACRRPCLCAWGITLGHPGRGTHLLLDRAAGPGCGQPADAPPPGGGSTFPGFIRPCGSKAALIRRIAASSAPPRHSGIM